MKNGTLVCSENVYYLLERIRDASTKQAQDFLIAKLGRRLNPERNKTSICKEFFALSEPEFVGKMPIRQDVQVLEANTVHKVSLNGWWPLKKDPTTCEVCKKRPVEEEVVSTQPPNMFVCVLCRMRAGPGVTVRHPSGGWHMPNGIESIFVANERTK